MLVPLTSTQPARPPSVWGRQNQRSAATNASWAAIRATVFACRRRSEPAKPRGIVATLLLIAEGHRGPFGCRVVVRRSDSRRVRAARVAELPTPEGPCLDRGVDVCGDGDGERTGGGGHERRRRGRADRDAAEGVPGQR